MSSTSPNLSAQASALRVEVQRRAQVWVVDDSPLQAELCRRVLAASCDVTVFDGGSAMLEALACEPAPQVLVLDWHMPDLSGIDVCKFVRETRNMGQFPILVITATQSPDSLLQALAAGANDFLRRPFMEAELVARVAALSNTALLHAQLADAQSALRVEAEFRERFMAMLAHDLRQPLNAIFMACEVMLQANASAQKAPHFVGVQLRAAARMKRMIAELLDFARSRPETGMPIQRQSIDLADVARSSLEELQLSNAGRHTFEVSVQGPVAGRWDPDRLAQICSNLFCNAIEHAPADTTVQVQLTGSENAVAMRVINVGPPIPETLLKTLFEPFRRGAGDRHSKGLGLGLHIVDQIVRAHGGAISVTSGGNQTEFTVNLPK